MTEISVDKKWEMEYPNGYKIYLAVYKQKIVHLKLWYLKHLRRYGKTNLYLLDRNGKLVEIIDFVLVDKKCNEGRTIISPGQEFNTIHEAWNYFQNLIFETIIKS